MKQKLKIEHNVPIPPKMYAHAWVKETLRNMNPGDSVLVESRTSQLSFLQRAKELHMKVTTRKINGSGFRIWRLNEELEKAL